MKLNIETPWRADEMEAKADQDALRKLFKVTYGYSLRSIPCGDPDCDLLPKHSREHRAGVAINTDHLIMDIERKTL